MSIKSPWQSPASIPEGILLRIFIHDSEDVENSRKPLRLSHVCQYWRRVVTSAPELWAEIDFKNANLAALALSRTTPDTHLHLRLNEVQTPAVDSAIYHFVKENWSRIGSLVISPANPDDDFPSILQFFADNPPPADTLNELCIFGDFYSHESDYEDDETPPPPPADRKPALELLASVATFRAVESLVLCSIEVPTQSPLYDNLVHLELYDHKPLIPVDQILDVFRRSPRLQSVTLDCVHDHGVPVLESPHVDLLELRTLDIRSKTFHSTVFILSHISMPNLDDLFVCVKSDDSGNEYSNLLAPFINSKLALSATALWLNDFYNGKTELRTYDYPVNIPHKLSFSVDNSSWERQRHPPSFLQCFSNIRKVSLSSGSTKISQMFRSHNNIKELMLAGDIDPQVFYDMCPRGSLETVQTLHLNCANFRSSTKKLGLQVLARAKNLRVLRLVPHGHVSQKEVRSFMEFGVNHGVWVQWMKGRYYGYDGEESDSSRRPRRTEKPVIPFGTYDADDEDFSADEIAGGTTTVGRKRVYASEEEKEPSITEDDHSPQRLTFHFPPSPTSAFNFPRPIRDIGPGYFYPKSTDLYEDMYESESEWEAEEDDGAMDID